MSDSVKQFKVRDGDDDIRIDRWFKRHYEHIPTGDIQKAMRKGLIRLDGKKVKPADRMKTGQELTVKYIDLNAAPTKREKPKVALTKKEIEETQSWVLFKNKDILVINKPAGLAVQGGSGLNDHLDRRLDALQFDAEGRPKLVHRLDKDTSGVLLLGRSTKAASALAQRFATKQADKIYIALIVGVPEIRSGDIAGDLVKAGDEHYESMQVVEEGEGQEALTAYDVIEALGTRMSVVQLKPITGRTHQLRVHMAQMGHPIVSDGKYGGKKAFVDGMDISKQLHLHARQIKLTNIFGEDIDVTAPFPPHMQASFSELGVSVGEDA